MEKINKPKPKHIDAVQLDIDFKDEKKEIPVVLDEKQELSTEYDLEAEEEDIKNKQEIDKLKEEIEKDYANEASEDLYGRYTRIAKEAKEKKEQQLNKPKLKSKTKKSKYPKNKNHKGGGYISGPLGSFDPYK